MTHRVLFHSATGSIVVWEGRSFRRVIKAFYEARDLLLLSGGSGDLELQQDTYLTVTLIRIYAGEYETLVKFCVEQDPPIKSR